MFGNVAHDQGKEIADAPMVAIQLALHDILDGEKLFEERGLLEIGAPYAVIVLGFKLERAVAAIWILDGKAAVIAVVEFDVIGLAVLEFVADVDGYRCGAIFWKARALSNLFPRNKPRVTAHAKLQRLERVIYHH